MIVGTKATFYVIPRKIPRYLRINDKVFPGGGGGFSAGQILLEWCE
jgi:hypothetical protein